MLSVDEQTTAFEKANRSLAAQDHRAAELILRELIEANPDKLQYREALAKTLFRLDQPAEALALFDEFVSRFMPTRDPTYEAVYVEGLRATKNSPVPFRRFLRFHELVTQLQATHAVAGETVECGCFRGLSSFLLCSYLRLEDPAFRGRGYHIYDSFQGLGEPTLDDEVPGDFENAEALTVMSQRGAFAASLATVKENLAAFPGITYHAGWIPATLRADDSSRYRFVHIDVDHYDPTWDCLEYFYPRLSPGGQLVSDDYGWPGARKAINEFCRDRGLRFVLTKYQQAVLRKAE